MHRFVRAYLAAPYGWASNITSGRGPCRVEKLKAPSTSVRRPGGFCWCGALRVNWAIWPKNAACIAGRRFAFTSLPEGAFGFSGLRLGWLYWVGRLQMPAMGCNVGLGLPVLPGDCAYLHCRKAPSAFPAYFWGDYIRWGRCTGWTLCA